MKAKSHNSIYLFKRLIAHFIDWYISSMLLIVLNVFCQRAKGIEPSYLSTLEMYDTTTASYVLILLLIANSIYYIVVPFFMNGQTFGKRILKLKIVSNNEEKPKLKKLIVREIVGVIVIEGYLGSFSSFFRTYLAMCFGDIKVLCYVWYAVCFVSIGIASSIKDHKMIHDIVGKTKVVSIK